MNIFHSMRLQNSSFTPEIRKINKNKIQFSEKYIVKLSRTVIVFWTCYIEIWKLWLFLFKQIQVKIIENVYYYYPGNFTHGICLCLRKLNCRLLKFYNEKFNFKKYFTKYESTSLIESKSIVLITLLLFFWFSY